MFTKQKIKNLIKILIFMIICTLSLLFYDVLNPFIIKNLKNNFNIVSNKGNALVHFINVDQADAVAINLPDGKVALIDTGSKEVNTDYINYLKSNVVNSKRDFKIDYLILSHADMDHVGGTMKLLKNFNVKNIYLPKISTDTIGYNQILNEITDKKEIFHLSNEFEIKNHGYVFRFFEILNETNTNDSSQIVKFTYLNKSFLFVGDVSSNIEKKYVEKYGLDLDSDVLKVSHHGSKTSTSSVFLGSVTPKYSVVSVGNNDYGHPSDEVLNRLDLIGSKVLRTDKDKDVLFVVGENYNLSMLNGNYVVTGLSLNYGYMVVVADVICLGVCVVVIIKKEKKKSKHRSKNLLV